MKRFISILLIFTVNLLFLTHALLPHHHHDGIPHFIFQAEHHHNSQEADDCCCPTETPLCDEECALDQDIEAICANDDEDDCHCTLCCASHDHSHLLLQALLLFYHYDFSLPDEPQEIGQPSYLTYHHEYIARSLGLRAPPFLA